MAGLNSSPLFLINHKGIIILLVTHLCLYSGATYPFPLLQVASEFGKKHQSGKQNKLNLPKIALTNDKTIFSKCLNGNTGQIQTYKSPLDVLCYDTQNKLIYASFNAPNHPHNYVFMTKQFSAIV